MIYPLKMVIFHSYVNVYQRVVVATVQQFYRGLGSLWSVFNEVIITEETFAEQEPLEGGANPSVDWGNQTWLATRWGSQT